MYEIDFETFSAAGFVWNGEKYVAPKGIAPGSKGLFCTGAWEYAAHESTEIMCLYYSVNRGPRSRWLPGDPPPQALLQHIVTGGLVEAHNSFFEFSIWTHVCVKKLGWPPIPLENMRCSAAKAGAFGLPRALEKGLKAMHSPVLKDMEGNRVMKRLSVPRKPTKNKPWCKHTPENSPEEFEILYAYCDTDVETEGWLSARCPELPPEELEVWKTDQRINVRGVYCDREFVLAAIELYFQAEVTYNARIEELTEGWATAATETEKIRSWVVAVRGITMYCFDKDEVKRVLDLPMIPPDVREVLGIRQGLGSSSVKKIFQMEARSRSDSRIRETFMYAGAGQTQRWAGAGTQPQNMPASGRDAKRCSSCDTVYGGAAQVCPMCLSVESAKELWDEPAIDAAKRDMLTGNLGYVESQWGDVCKLISSCLRGMFTAAPGMDLICSDYSAIEAVVLACLAGEQWRIDVFNSHGKIYEMAAAQITGIPFEDLLAHKEATGEHHPARKTHGKVAELASGYQGGLGAWKAFGADKFMTDDEIKAAITAWRAANPSIVQFWYNLEDAAVAAIRNPGQAFAVGVIVYQMDGPRLTCRLPSGRFIYYHDVTLRPGTTPWGAAVDKIYYYRLDPYTKQWSEADTYGGKLCENVTQAIARDILAHALPKLECAGYPVVLHVHDEAAAEVPEGSGSIEEVERVMGDLPPWVAGWPIKAAGGWRGKRYKKD